MSVSWFQVDPATVQFAQGFSTHRAERVQRDRRVEGRGLFSHPVHRRQSGRCDRFELRSRVL